MKDYARMTAEQKTAYNEGLLDAIDRLMAVAERDAGSVVAAGLRVAAAELRVFRNEQINAGPQ